MRLFGLAVFMCAVGLLGAGQGLAQETPAAAAWHVEFALTPPPGQPADPWSPRTVVGGDSLRSSSQVTWLDGLQRQASHLGMATASGGAQPSVVVRGLRKLVGNIPFVGASMGGLFEADAAESDAGDGAPIAGAAGQTLPPISELPGADRREAASREPCPDDRCFARRLINWDRSLAACTKDVRIGVIDTSFDLAHPAFKRLRVVRKEFISGVQASDEDWHGTAILSLLAGDPESGTPGLVPDATFLLATAFRSDAAGNATTDRTSLRQALEWLDSLDVDVVNMSFAGPPEPEIAEIIQRMSLNGVMFAAAAGNMGPTAPPSYPGAYPHVIAVTAVNRDGENYRSANRGDYIDISAPGVDILTALPNGKQGLQTGTSFAVPFVTAILATRVSSGMIDGTEDLLLERITGRNLGPPGRDAVYGAGLAIAPATCPSPSVVAKASKRPQKSAKAKKRSGLIDLKW